MTDLLGAFVVLVLLAFIAAAEWLLICNDRTYRQRGRLINWACSGDISWEEHLRRRQFCVSVSYDDHLWALARGKPWWTLYGFQGPNPEDWA